MVRNLHTGFVSPQYHLVFDDNYDTIYHESKSEEEIDAICQKLFDNNRECHVEEEYDDEYDEEEDMPITQSGRAVKPRDRLNLLMARGVREECPEDLVPRQWRWWPVQSEELVAELEWW